MKFVIGGKKYDTEKMEKVANVKKWYEVDNILTRAIYGGKEVGRFFNCELWRSKKGNWLLTTEYECKNRGEAISECEAMDLLMKYDTDVYEKIHGELPEA